MPETAHGSGIHPAALVDADTDVHPLVEIGPWCQVGPGVRIGARTRPAAHVVVTGPTVLGGAAQQWRPSVDEERLDAERGRLMMGARTTIREYVTVGRGTHDGRSATIGDDRLLMAQVHVGHDTVIGDRSILANGAQVAGHITLAEGVRLADLSGVMQRVRVGRLSFVAGFGDVTRRPLAGPLACPHPCGRSTSWA